MGAWSFSIRKLTYFGIIEENKQGWLNSINLLLTEREGRTGEYWPKVVAVRAERSEVCTKRPRANIPRYGSS